MIVSKIGDWKQAADELDAIVASFDEGEVSVDDLFVKLERATAIIESLEARLDATRAKVEELAPRLAKVVDNE
jgi:exodeoxyribonuclease VII small subunit